MAEPNPRPKKKDKIIDAQARADDRREKRKEASRKRRMELAEKRADESLQWLVRAEAALRALNKRDRGKKLTASEQALLDWGAQELAKGGS